MSKVFKSCCSLAIGVCFLFLSACSSAEETGEKNIELMLSAIFTIGEEAFDVDSETQLDDVAEYYENAQKVANKVCAVEDYMDSKLAVYTPVLLVSDRTSAEYKYVDITENEAAESDNYKDYLITVYVDCTYSNKDKACEVINGRISIDKDGKITYFDLEM